MMIRVLLALEPASLRKRMQRLIADPHVLVTAARIDGLRREVLGRQPFDLIVVSDRAMPLPVEELLEKVRALPDQPEVVVICAKEKPEQRAALLAAGCYAVIYEGLEDGSIEAALDTLIARRREETIRRLGVERMDFRPRLQDFVSSSAAMQAFMDMVHRVRATDSSLLILGETGVGKERLARAIHFEGPRAGMPFIAVNCAALPETLLESELFGHEEGAFTGAGRARRGYFELAHKGTIFLDEICELPFHLQAKLLQVLQDHTLHPIGSEKFVKIDVRVIVATNRDIEEEIRAKRFRKDLFYRLSVVTLKIPPLRERRKDIPALLESYLEHFRRRLGRTITGFDGESMQALVRYDWPGNVRELINVVERAVLLCPGNRITLRDLPDSLNGTARKRAGAIEQAVECDPEFPDAPAGTRPWREAREEMLARFEETYFRSLLALTRGRIGETAHLAGIAPRSLLEKMKRHGLRKEDFKPPRRIPRGMKIQGKGDESAE